MNLMMMLGMFVSVNLFITLFMFTIKHIAHVQNYNYSALWRPWIVKIFFDLVANVVQNNVC